ncbi:UDP-N-acetylmuramoyl-tripeptide--D-alanyl-D-alanine ligase [Bacillus smithii]|uniref:UDP-N-acetylmuramoyl-tripeptide--D-alanyl-D- alanine ligase n=1 Tax=Bacillus smithii TaxID=1479 RepID=UPI003D1E2315
MIVKTIQQVAEMMGAPYELSHKDIVIQGVSIDSRKIEKGNLFVPLKGDHTDGHRYVETAFQNGAAASLWQKDVPNPPEHFPIIMVDDTLEALQRLAKAYRDELSIKVVGVTGSNGKTTTKDIISSLLSSRYRVQKTEGNYNNHIGLPLTLLSLKQDTEAAILEMGMSSKGEIDFLTRMARPDIAVITNIGEAHLLDLGSREAIAEAKFEIINGLDKNGVLVYHGDEPLLERLVQNTPHLTAKTFGESAKNDLYPTKIRQTNEGSRFSINTEPEREFFLSVLGKHNVFNALAAILVARELGISYDEIEDGLKKIELTKMRLELVEGSKGEKIINDAYNASPTSVRAAIDLVSELQGYERKILVLGDMLELGPKEKQYHEEIGKEINPHAIDYVFTIGELGQYIAKGAKTVLPEHRVFAFMEKEKLVEKLKSLLTGNELILVKASRGMKLEEVVHLLQA